RQLLDAPVDGQLVADLVGELEDGLRTDAAVEVVVQQRLGQAGDDLAGQGHDASSRFTVSGSKAGAQIATYSAPSGPTEERTLCPARVRTDCPAVTSTRPSSCSTTTLPEITSVTSSKAGVCAGSSHPGGAFMCAIDIAVSPVATLPTCSAMTLPPGTSTIAGW